MVQTQQPVKIRSEYVDPILRVCGPEVLSRAGPPDKLHALDQLGIEMGGAIHLEPNNRVLFNEVIQPESISVLPTEIFPIDLPPHRFTMPPDTKHALPPPALRSDVDRGGEAEGRVGGHLVIPILTYLYSVKLPLFVSPSKRKP